MNRLSIAKRNEFCKKQILGTVQSACNSASVLVKPSRRTVLGSAAQPVLLSQKYKSLRFMHEHSDANGIVSLM